MTQQLGAQGTDRPRYATLEDYLMVLRRQKWILVVLTLIGLVAGFVLAGSQTTTYTASSELSYRDISQDFAFLGVDSRPSVAPPVLAAVNAESLDRPQIANPVAREFKGELSREAVIAAASARVSVSTGLVVVQATTGDPDLSVRLANAFADRMEKVGTNETDRRLGRAAGTIEREIESLATGRSAERGDVQARIALLEGQLQRLETLRSIARPVEVIDRASDSSVRAESGGPVLLTMVGGTLGLIAGLLMAFVRETLDRRLRSAKDLHREIHAPVLGRIPASAFGKTWSATAPGANAMDPDFEAFRALRSSLTYLTAEDGSGVRTVLVTSAAPDEGKTTVSVGLAAAAAQVGQSVLLLETDLRRPSLANTLGVAPGPGLSEYLSGTVNPSSVVQMVPVAPLVTGGEAPSQPGAWFGCITAGALRSDGARLLSSERFAATIAELRDAYDLVVLDGSPLLAAADSMDLVRHADTVLICARLGSTNRDQVRAVRSVIDNLGAVQVGAVATGLSRKGPDSYDYYYSY